MKILAFVLLFSACAASLPYRGAPGEQPFVEVVSRRVIRDGKWEKDAVGYIVNPSVHKSKVVFSCDNMVQRTTVPPRSRTAFLPGDDCMVLSWSNL